MKDVIYKIIFYLILISFFCFFALFISKSETAELIYHIPDDASYYLKIGMNYSEGYGTTFDKINLTNGFQPLWQYIVTGISSVMKTSTENLLRSVLFVQLIIISLSAIIFFKTVSGFFGNKAALGCSIVFLLFVYSLCINGMESALMVILLLILIKYISQTDYLYCFNLKNDILISALSGLLILSRLDMVMFAFALLIYLTVNGLTAEDAKKMYFNKAAVLMIIVSVVILPYLINNFIMFGNFFPVSGFLKTGITDIPLSDKLTELFAYRETYFAMTSFLYIVFYAAKVKNTEKNFFKKYSDVMLIFSISCILLYVFLILFVDWVIFYWYFIPFAVFFSFVSVIPLYYLSESKKLFAGNIVYFSFLIIILFYWGSKIIINYNQPGDTLQNNWNLESYKATLWAKSNTNPDDIFAMKDAGHFGFFSERRVINLDGLVNNFDYQEVLKEKKLNDYLKLNKVKYIVQHALWNRPDVTDGKYDSLELKYNSHRYSVQSDPVTVYRKNEVYRSEPYLDGNNRVSFIIWKLN